MKSFKVSYRWRSSLTEQLYVSGDIESQSHAEIFLNISVKKNFKISLKRIMFNFHLNFSDAVLVNKQIEIFLFILKR